MSEMPAQAEQNLESSGSFRSEILDKAGRVVDNVSRGKDQLRNFIERNRNNIKKGTLAVGFSFMLAACGSGDLTSSASTTSFPSASPVEIQGITQSVKQESSPTNSSIPTDRIINVDTYGNPPDVAPPIPPHEAEVQQGNAIIKAEELEKTPGAIIRRPPRLSSSPYFNSGELIKELDKMDKSRYEIIKTEKGTFAIYKIDAAMFQKFPFDLLHITLNSDSGSKGGPDGDTINFETDLTRQQVVDLLNSENPYSPDGKEPSEGGGQALTIVFGHQSPVEGAKNFIKVPDNFIMPDAKEPTGETTYNPHDPFLMVDFQSLAIDYYNRGDGKSFGSAETNGDPVFTTTYSGGAFYPAGV